ncbi:MAG TPA: hypothetical protein VIS72_02970, partial [Anaerolineales bacterium]
VFLTTLLCIATTVFDRRRNMKFHNDLTSLIGGTPLLRLGHLAPDEQIYKRLWPYVFLFIGFLMGFIFVGSNT